MHHPSIVFGLSPIHRLDVALVYHARNRIAARCRGGFAARQRSLLQSALPKSSAIKPVVDEFASWNPAPPSRSDSHFSNSPQ